jgi:hypothetical protein
MADKLTKYERKLVSQGASGARTRAKSQARTGRILGLGAGLLAAKVDASGALAMTVPLPMIGETKVSVIAGWGLMLAPMLMRNPGTLTQAGGMAGFALVARGIK